MSQKVVPSDVCATDQKVCVLGENDARPSTKRNSLFSALRTSTDHSFRVRESILREAQRVEESFFVRIKGLSVSIRHHFFCFILVACMGVVVGIIGAAAQRKGQVSLILIGILLAWVIQGLAFGLLLKFSVFENSIASCLPFAIGIILVWCGSLFPFDELAQNIFTTEDHSLLGSYSLLCLGISGLVFAVFALNFLLNIYFTAKYGAISQYQRNVTKILGPIIHTVAFSFVGFLQLLFLFKLFVGEGSAIEQFLIVCIAFPLYSALGLRIYVADHTAWEVIKLMTSTPNDDWKTTDMLRIRVHFITVSKVLTAVPGTLSMLSVGTTLAFAGGVLFSGMIEVFGVIAQFSLNRWSAGNASALQSTPEENERDMCIQAQEFRKAYLETSNLSSARNTIFTYWKKDFQNPFYAKKSFALSCMVENRCEIHVIVACATLIAYSNPHNVNEVAVRALAMLFTEVCLVDTVKQKLLQKLFEIHPFENTSMQAIERATLLGWIGVELSACSLAKFLLLGLGFQCIF